MAKRIAWLLLSVTVALFLLAILYGPISTLTRSDFYKVERVLNGDTLLMESGERVRLLGVNASQNQAKEFTQRMVEGKPARLEFDAFVGKQDKYARLLAYVFLQDGTHVNAEIIRQGYGFVYYSQPPLKHQDTFRRLESEAREQRRGLWAINR